MNMTRRNLLGSLLFGVVTAVGASGAIAAPIFTRGTSKKLPPIGELKPLPGPTPPPPNGTCIGYGLSDAGQLAEVSYLSDEIPPHVKNLFIYGSFDKSQEQQEEEAVNAYWEWVKTRKPLEGQVIPPEWVKAAEERHSALPEPLRSKLLHGDVFVEERGEFTQDTAEKVKSLRSEAWRRLRERLKMGTIQLPPREF
jgi:hypothetical protein